MADRTRCFAAACCDHPSAAYLHDISVAFLELLKAVQDDELDVVVRLGHQQLAEAVGCSSDGSRGLAQGHQGDRTLVHHSRAGALEQRQDDLDVLALL